MALALNSIPIEGRAMLMDDPTKGVKNEVKTATINAYFLGDMSKLPKVLFHHRNILCIGVLFFLGDKL